MVFPELFFMSLLRSLSCTENFNGSAVARLFGVGSPSCSLGFIHINMWVEKLNEIVYIKET